MATLYLDRREIELRVDGGTLLVYEQGERRTSIPVSGLERVVARSTVRLDTRVLGTLARRGAGFVCLSPRRGRGMATLVGSPHNDVVRRLGQYGAYLDPTRREIWSRELVHAKLAAQRRLLERALLVRPDLRRRLTTGTRRIEAILARIEPAGGTVLGLGTLRGLEGAGAAAYFGAFTALFPASLRFEGRNRRPPRDPVNACLSLGYTLVHAEAVLSCHAAGLDPMLGFFHEPAFGRESLATDVIEPLRPHIDEWVWGLFRERVLTAEHFRQDGEACLLGKAGRQHFYHRYEPLARRIRRLMRRHLGALARVLAKESPVRLTDPDGEERSS